MTFDLPAIQTAIRAQALDGWLLYDFRGLNVLAARVAGTLDGHRTRRWAYFIPATGEPRKLVHRIEPGSLDHLPGAQVEARNPRDGRRVEEAFGVVVRGHESPCCGFTRRTIS